MRESAKNIFYGRPFAAITAEKRHTVENTKSRRYRFVYLLLLVIPSVAEANAGTPLMWAGMLHLVFGNFIIGIFEGILLAKIFGLSKRICIPPLILANYLSAWLGGLVIAKTVAHALPMDLYNAWPLFWLMVFITYVLTLLLEYPFVAVVFRGDPLWRQKSVRGSFLIQTLSYVILFGWYWSVSGTSLYTRTKVVDASAISLPEGISLYFISVDDGDVYGGLLHERQWQNVFDLNSSNRNDRLLVRPSPQTTNTWDLVARLEMADHRNPQFVTMEQQFCSIATPPWRERNTDPPQYEGTWFNFGQVPKLGNAETSSWKVWAGFWPGEGLRGTETTTGKRASFSFETPFISWMVRNAILLPTDKVVLQLGDDQICVYDPDNNQIALLTPGRGPVAVIRGKKNGHSY